ncbi:MAG: hypothetical protein DRP01_04235 [Archaeoglobales archaeon]|nr:MAG: hypothetical protein DRP01_04235 [Archaeoglobales archaeon]
MPERPYLWVESVDLAANGRGTVMFAQDANEEFHVNRIWFESTGAFAIESIRDGTGQYYTNASPDTPIPSTMLDLPQTTNGGIGKMPIELTILPAVALYIDLVDTSGSANTVKVVLEGRKAPV